ncbi:hypothetical protein KIL84_013471 [Mauremys mutica]|uniref:Uncharacterized protein n=1 Tax=Mauremys mutica TaxID=74926 RepID=A0A9D3WXA7_9SAUR|nr:hypothetical protein KIL84_013471 [Mauremys mutica]
MGWPRPRAPPRRLVPLPGTWEGPISRCACSRCPCSSAARSYSLLRGRHHAQRLPRGAPRGPWHPLDLTPGQNSLCSGAGKAAALRSAPVPWHRAAWPGPSRSGRGRGRLPPGHAPCPSLEVPRAVESPWRQGVKQEKPRVGVPGVQPPPLLYPPPAQVPLTQAIRV